jgi:hypothetical protein
MFTQCGIRGIPTTELESTAENKYLAAENRILKAQVKGRLLLSQEKKPHWPRSLTGWDERRWKKWKRTFRLLFLGCLA